MTHLSIVRLAARADVFARSALVGRGVPWTGVLGLDEFRGVGGQPAAEALVSDTGRSDGGMVAR
jgi:hypothetical protein